MGDDAGRLRQDRGRVRLAGFGFRRDAASGPSLNDSPYCLVNANARNMMKILKSYDHVCVHIDNVISHADNNKDTLGFLPRSVFIEHAKAGLLWTAVDCNNALAGFLLFGKNMKYEIKVKQIFVLESFRRVNVAKILINDLLNYARKIGILSVTARVAADLPANNFWDKLGFRSFAQEQGGLTTGRQINIRVKHINSGLLDLMGCQQFQDIQKKPLALRPVMGDNRFVIDMNVFFDIIKNRDQSNYARSLICSGLSHEFKLFVTPEFEYELERNRKDGPDPVLEFALNLPCLPRIKEENINIYLDRLYNIIFPGKLVNLEKSKNRKSDLIHLIYCIHHRVSGFITRDKAILSAGDKLKTEFGLDVLSPIDIISPYFGGPTQQHVCIEEIDMKVSHINDKNEVVAVNFLQKFGLMTKDIEEILNYGTRQFPRNLIMISIGNVIVAVSSWYSNKHTPGKLHIYVDESHPIIERAIDHIFEAVSRSGTYGKLRAVILPSTCHSPKVIDTASKRGFLWNPVNSSHHDKAMVKPYFHGVITQTKWQGFRRDFERIFKLTLPTKMPKSDIITNTGIAITDSDTRALHNTLSLFQFETLISPGLLVYPGREALIIPIKSKYAETLLPDACVQGCLWGKEASLYLERAYFRAPRDIKTFKIGMPVVFYVSGKLGGAVACARITYSELMSIDEARTLFIRQGVLNEDDMKKCAIGDRLHAFTFDNLSIFSSVISYNDLDKNYLISGRRMVSHEKLSPLAFQRYIGNGFWRKNDMTLNALISNKT